MQGCVALEVHFLWVNTFSHEFFVELDYIVDIFDEVAVSSQDVDKVLSFFVFLGKYGSLGSVNILELLINCLEQFVDLAFTDVVNNHLHFVIVVLNK